jgi:hypothetical protein
MADAEPRIIFDSVKEHRGWYFVEYSVPNHGDPFAHLSLTVLEDRGKDRVVAAMKNELRIWTRRFPVAVFVSSCDDKGDSISVKDMTGLDYLVGWPSAQGETVMHWRLVGTEEWPKRHWTSGELKAIYASLPSRTLPSRAEYQKEQRRTVRLGTALVMLVFVVAPAAWAIIEFNSPQWLARLLLFYALGQLYIRALKFLGMWPKTAADEAKAREELAMKHHHSHCERNPEGFNRLKAENFEREERKRIKALAESLKSKDAL